MPAMASQSQASEQLGRQQLKALLNETDDAVTRLCGNLQTIREMLAEQMPEQITQHDQQLGDAVLDFDCVAPAASKTQRRRQRKKSMFQRTSLEHIGDERRQLEAAIGPTSERQHSEAAIDTITSKTTTNMQDDLETTKAITTSEKEAAIDTIDLKITTSMQNDLKKPRPRRHWRS